MKPFDERFADHVRHVFDEYHEDVDEKALADFKHRMAAHPAGQKPPFWVWAAAAAMLLASATFLLWRPAGPSEATSEITSQPPVSSLQTPSASPSTDAATSAESPSGLPAAPNPTPTSVAPRNATASTSADQPATPPPSEEHHTSQTAPAIAAAPSDTASQAAGPPRPKPLTDTEVSPIAGSLKENGIEPPWDVLPKRLPSSRTTFGLTAGSSVTVARGQIARGAGFAGGVTADIPLHRGLSLTMGTILSYNAFEYDPRGTGNSMDMQTIAQTNVNGVVDLSVEHASRVEWLGIDIPVNLKWRPAGLDGRTHLAVGLSSMVYLREETEIRGHRYTGTAVYITQSNSYVMDVQSTPYVQNGNEGALSRSDWGRLLNLHVGQTVDIARQPVTFELYVKYPLGGLTSQDVALGLGGMSVRIPLGGR